MGTMAGSTESMQRLANDGVWVGGAHVSAYANRVLRPVEVIVFARYRDELAGRILELGCGAGRLTGYLAALASHVHGIDVSANMVATCRARYPGVTTEVRDMRDLAAFPAESFDVVVAGFNVLDVVGHEERTAVLAEIHRTLAPGGLLVMSSHNRAVVNRLAEPLQLRGRPPRALISTMIRLPRWQWNRRRLVGYERDEATYAIRNDVAHNYAVLHYYIDRDAQEAQLAVHGFELLECLDLEGQVVDRGDPRPASSELHYVARRGG